jgi:hypothetical protein
MKKFDWIESAGGPLVIISDNVIDLWSGIYKRESYLLDKIEDADDFMDSTETDYGKSCLIDDYLGLVEVAKEDCLVFGDEPMRTTIFSSLDNEIHIARLYCCATNDIEHFADKLLSNLDPALVENWEYKLTVTFNSEKQFLFDAAIDGKELRTQEENMDFLLSHLKAGQYKVFTTEYEPDGETKLFLHRLVAIN